MNELLVIGPCLYPNTKPAQLLIESAISNGITPRFYGLGATFTAHGADAQVFRLRQEMEHYRDYKVTLVTDVADVLLLAGEEEILSKFRYYDCPLVMSAEQGHWPDEGLADQFPGNKDGYRYPNAGQYIGYTDAVIECLDWLLEKYRGKHPGMDNSQPWWTWMYIRREKDFELDRSCYLFQTMSGGAASHVYCDRQRIFNTATGTYPCAVHFNGPGNEKPYQEMYRRLFEQK